MLDDATEPLQVQASTSTPTQSWFKRPVMMGASAGLGALLAANIVLVWAVSIGPQSARIEAKSVDVAAAPAVAPPAAPAPSGEAPSASAGLDSLDPFGATPAGASASSGGTSFAGSASDLQSPTLGAFTPAAPAIPGGSAFPTFPGLDPAATDAVTPFLPALSPAAVSGDAVVSALTAGGGWLTSAVVSAGNNATLLLGNLILYYAYTNGSGIGPGQIGLANLMALPQIASSLQAAAASLPSLGLPSLPAPDLAGLPAALAALAGTSVPSLGLPSLPPPDLAGLSGVLAALTATGMPALPQIPIPQLPPLPQIPVPQLPQIPLPQFPAPHLWPFF